MKRTLTYSLIVFTGLAGGAAPFQAATAADVLGDAGVSQQTAMVAPAQSQPSAPTHSAAPLDVALSQNGYFSGTMVDPQGTPLSGWPVVVTQDRREVANTVTDAQGRFAFTGMRGGLYNVSGGEDSRICRMWAEGAAPPNSASGVQLYGGTVDTLRGQMARVHNVITSPLFIGGVVGGAIALPLALHNRQPRS